MSHDTNFQEHFIHANGLRFCVHERGEKDAPAIVFIMGFACQMTTWPAALLDRLAAQGYRVICFDNRDIGLSDSLKSTHRINIRTAFIKHRLGRRFHATYTLHDMAHDTVELMSAMGLARAHLVGASMGGMIAQIIAAKYADRVASLNLIMTSTNAPNQPLPHLSVLKEFAKTTGISRSNDPIVDRLLRLWKAIQSPGYPKSDDDIRAMIKANYKRSYKPSGTIRQLQAILATGNIAHLLPYVSAPTLIIHGKHDPLLPIKNAQIIAKKIDLAIHVPIDGMGHDLPEPLLPYFAELIADNTRQVRASISPNTPPEMTLAV